MYFLHDVTAYFIPFAVFNILGAHETDINKQEGEPNVDICGNSDQNGEKLEKHLG